MKYLITVMILIGALNNSYALLLGSEFTYQGELNDINGNPHQGNFDFNFKLYSDVSGTNQIGSSVLVEEVFVDKGIFTTQIDFGDAVFSGDKVWLEINVRNGTSTGGFTQLLPLQQVTSTPYAIHAQFVGMNSVTGSEVVNGTINTADLTDSSVTGAKIADNTIGTADYQDNSITSIKISAPLKLSALITGDTANPPEESSVISGVNTSTSLQNNMFGVYGKSTGHYSSGYTISNYPAGVYGLGISNAYGIKGIAGDVSSITSTPTGGIGVVGIGENRGVVGQSNSGTGVYSSSITNYGIWGQSTSYRGVTGRTSRADNNYGFYTPDNSYSSNYTLKGGISKVFKYNGKSILKRGDVVSFSGIVAGEKSTDDPVVLVTKAIQSSNTSIAGVVLSRFNIEAVSEDENSQNKSQNLDPTPIGPVQPGDYVLVVVEGPVAINIGNSKAQLGIGSTLYDYQLLDDNSTAKNKTTGQAIGTYLGHLQTNDNKGLTEQKAYVYVNPK